MGLLGGGIHQLDVLSVLILTADKQKLNSENFLKIEHLIADNTRKTQIKYLE